MRLIGDRPPRLIAAMSRLDAPEIDLIHARLRRAGARLRRHVLVDAALIGAVVGAAGFVLAAIARRVIGTGLLPAADWPGDLAAAGVLAAVVALAVALWRLMHLPDAGGLARLADRRFALDERMSTAIGLTDAGPDGAVLRRALLADAAAHLPRVEPALMAPFRPTSVGLALPVLAALGLAVVLLIPLPPAAPGAVLTAEAPLDEADRAAAAEDVTRVADLMREQAEVRDDPYMEAVARTLDSLAARLESDPGLTRAEAVAALDALSAEARAAGTDWRGDAGARLPEMVAALAEMLAEPPPPPGAPAPGDIPDAMAAGLNGEPTAPGAPGPAQPSGTPREGLEAMLDEFAQGQGQPAGAAPPGSPPSPVVQGSFNEPIRSPEEMAAQRAAQASEQAQLMGPSANAQAGESILAGEGTDALDQADAGAVAVTFETSGDFVLEANVAGEGRQMLRDLPPETVLSPVTAFDLAEAQANWQALPPAAAWRDRIGPAERVAVQDYFLALAAEVAR